MNAEKTEQNRESAYAIPMTNTNTKTKRGPRRLNHTGCLINKGPGRAYLAKWMVNGKTMYRTTGESDYRKALKKLDEYTRPTRQDSVEDMIAALEAQLAILRGKLSRKEIPVAELWDTYESIQDWGSITDGTKKGYESAVRGLSEWASRHGARNVSDLDNALAWEYLKEAQGKLGIVSYNCRLVLYKRVWTVLSSRKEYAIPEDTWAGREKLKGAKHASKRRALTSSEVRSLLDKADPETKLLVQIGAYTGLRISDCATLKWEDVDMDAKVINITPLKTKRHGTKVVIPLHADLLQALQDTPHTSPYVCEHNAHDYKSGHIQDRVSKLFEACGIETSEVDAQGKRHVLTGFHALRHFFASQLAKSGASIATAQELLGHSSASMSLHYTHSDEESIREGVNALKVA